MKITLKNLGVIKQAEFELGDLTVICGNNNTGKTYAAYALFGFLYKCQNMLSAGVAPAIVKTLLDEGSVRIDLTEYLSKADRILEKGCAKYSMHLPKIFSSRDALFEGSQFQITADKALSLKRRFKGNMGSKNTDIFSFSKNADDQKLVVSLLVKKGDLALPNELISQIISDVIIQILFDNLLPAPFIASAERTGASIFRNELDFSRNRLLKDMHNLAKDKDPRELLFKNYQEYALPVERNVEFIRKLPEIAKRTSFIAKQHPEILDNFAEIIGGKYGVDRNGVLHFKPDNTTIKLTISECSSAVRSLLDIGFYIHHIAKAGDLLIVDEPELNLHPENQCRIARLFACLVNIGIKVFITTHSDYIVKEFNTLIMLNSNKPHIKEVARAEGYSQKEFISSDKIKVYITEKSKPEPGESATQNTHMTLTPASIDSELGIKVKTFDRTINKMNSIQESIVYGGD